MHSVEEIKNGVYWMGCNDFLTLYLNGFSRFPTV